MISFQNVSVGYGAQQVLADVSFQINAGERVGIVGPNGAGKSTIFSMITGETSPDRGEVSSPRGVRISHLRQQLMPSSSGETLLDYSENGVPAVREAHREIEAVEHALQGAVEPERGRLVRRLGELQTAFEHQGGYELNTRAQAALCGLGFKAEELQLPFASFSGGWQMRAELARALVGMPDLLLLDEPTNFLDIPAVEWLQRFLRGFSGTILLISHDRYLLNSLCDVTVEVAGGMVTRYAGNYDRYVRDRQQRHDQLDSARKNQDRRKEQIERFVERFRAKNTKSSQVQSRIKMLEKMDEVAVPRIVVRAPRIRVPRPPHCGVEVMRLDQAGLSYDGTRWVFRELDLRIERGDKLGLVGLNGTGKTTLLRILAGRLPLSEGRRVENSNAVIGYQAQDFAETMDSERTVLETVRAAAGGLPERDVRSLLGGFFFSGDAVEKKVSVLSGGEKMRLAFARLLVNPPNFLLLDEPTTHLDIPSREALEQALADYAGTLCLVSHDIDFVRKVATGILAMWPDIRRFPGNYDYYREKTDGLAVGESAEARSRPDGGRGGDRKAERRERAMQRQEVNRQKRPLEAAVRKAEAEVAKLEREQKELATSLETPGENVEFARISRRLGQIEYELRIASEAWEQAALALESFEKDSAAGDDEDA